MPEENGELLKNILRRLERLENRVEELTLRLARAEAMAWIMRGVAGAALAFLVKEALSRLN